MERALVLMLFASLSLIVLQVFGPSSRERIVLRRAGAVRPSKQDPLALEDEEMALPFTERVLGPALQSIRSVVLRYTPVGARRRAEERLLRAGRPIEVGTLFTMRILSLGIGLGLGLLMFAATPHVAFERRILLFIGCAALGSLAPVVWIDGQGNRRRSAIEVALPDVLDLLCVSVEAGLGFDAAIQRVGEKFKGPAGQEIQEYIKEVRLGRSRVEALRGLARRIDLADMRSFVAALVQAEQLGVSLAHVLRVQSDQMRGRRRLRAQERGMKVPVKMLFPLVFLILPTIFIILFAPVAVHLMETLGGQL